MPPPGPTVLDRLGCAASRSSGSARSSDIFSGQGITEAAIRTRTTTAWTSRSSTCADPARLRLHEPRGLRLEVRPSQRSRRVRGGDRGVRPAAARADRRPRRRGPAHHGRSRLRSDHAASTDHSRERTPLLAPAAGGPTSRDGPFADLGRRGGAPRGRGRGLAGASRVVPTWPRRSRGRRRGWPRVELSPRRRIESRDPGEASPVSSSATLERDVVVARKRDGAALLRRDPRVRRGIHARATSPMHSPPRS